MSKNDLNHVIVFACYSKAKFYHWNELNPFNILTQPKTSNLLYLQWENTYFLKTLKCYNSMFFCLFFHSFPHSNFSMISLYLLQPQYLWNSSWKIKRSGCIFFSGGEPRWPFAERQNFVFLWRYKKFFYILLSITLWKHSLNMYSSFTHHLCIHTMDFGIPFYNDQ